MQVTGLLVRCERSTNAHDAVPRQMPSQVGGQPVSERTLSVKLGTQPFDLDGCFFVHFLATIT
jgi:hypothetical protein